MTQQSVRSSGTSLRRAPSDRVWAGVAAAIANRLDIAPGLVRAAFVVTSLFGGLGLVLYIAGWVLIPAEGDSEGLLERWIRDGDRVQRAGAILIGLGILSIPWGIFDRQVVFAVVLAVVGVLLYKGTFDDRRAGDRSSTIGSAGNDAEGGGAGLIVEDGDADHDEPADRIDQPDWPPRTNRPARRRSVLGRVVIAALMVVVGFLAIADNWWLSVGAAQYLAAALLVIGAGLLVGAWWGRARATIFLGIPLVILVQLAGVFHVPVTGGFGDPVFTPHTIEELKSEYRLSAGQLTVDLRGIRLEGEQRVVASVGAGELTIWVPNDVDVIVSADALAGEVQVQGEVKDGFPASIEREIRVEDPKGTLVLDLDVVFGQINVMVGPPDPISEQGAE